MDDDDPPAPRALTLEHVARAAGVSRATVSRVINGTRNVDPGLQEVVQRAIEATGYMPNRAARWLATRRNGSVGLVISAAEHHSFDDPFLGPAFSDPFFGRLASGALRALRGRGVHLVLMLAQTDDARDEVVRGLRQGDVDGVLLISLLGADDPLPGALAKDGVPVVLFGRPPQPMPISFVDAAQHAGAMLAADHLVARGCQQVGMIAGPPDFPGTRDRLTGFQDAMARHGHPYIPTVEGDFSLSSGERAMEELLVGFPETDGVFVANDLMANGALLVLRDHGRRVPDDVAVVGFDDSSAATTCRPPLTTVRQPLEDMAAEMAQMLMERIEQPKSRVRSVIFEPTLVQRSSA